jgi:hypothetical protein
MGQNDNWTDREIIASFFKMVYTVVLWVAWLIFSIFLGIVKDWAFFDDPHIGLWQHIVFYLWLVCTLPLLVWVTVVRIWKIWRR